MAQHRLFIGIKLDSAELKEGVKCLKATCPSEFTVRWQRPSQWHITLAFLGNVDEGSLQKLKHSLSDLWGSVMPSPLILRGIFYFTSAELPRIIYVGVEPKVLLAQEHIRLTQRLANCGFKFDSREFIPHVTIARVRRLPAGFDNDHWQSWIKSYQNQSFGVVRHPQVHLMESHLRPSGARYKIII